MEMTEQEAIQRLMNLSEEEWWPDAISRRFSLSFGPVSNIYQCRHTVQTMPLITHLEVESQDDDYLLCVIEGAHSTVALLEEEKKKAE